MVFTRPSLTRVLEGVSAYPFFQRLFSRDRAFVLAGLTGLVLLAWLYLLRFMPSMVAGVMPAEETLLLRPWGLWDLVLTFGMWTVMMVAVMVPSAMPMLLVLSAVYQNRSLAQTALVRTGVFLAGYLLAWCTFSVLAALAQWSLNAAPLHSFRMATTRSLLEGIFLVAAGMYQFTPLKEVCLSHCRSPHGFLMTEWREGGSGALIMGVRYGAFCIGCCWLLMSLMLVAGAMSLIWMAILTGLIAIEKVAPAGRWVSRAAGLFLIGWGAWMAAGALR